MIEFESIKDEIENQNDYLVLKQKYPDAFLGDIVLGTSQCIPIVHVFVKDEIGNGVIVGTLKIQS